MPPIFSGLRFNFLIGFAFDQNGVISNTATGMLWCSGISKTPPFGKFAVENLDETLSGFEPTNLFMSTQAWSLSQLHQLRVHILGNSLFFLLHVQDTWTQNGNNTMAGVIVLGNNIILIFARVKARGLVYVDGVLMSIGTDYAQYRQSVPKRIRKRSTLSQVDLTRARLIEFRISSEHRKQHEQLANPILRAKQILNDKRPFYFKTQKLEFFCFLPVKKF